MQGNAGSTGALSQAEELADDIALLAIAALNLADVGDNLYVNVSKGIPVDLGILSYPDIEASQLHTNTHYNTL